jgi:hypothetical protein
VGTRKNVKFGRTLHTTEIMTKTNEKSVFLRSNNATNLLHHLECKFEETVAAL